MNKLLSLIYLCITFSLSAQINLDSALVAYYPFNGNANDESENDIHAIAVDTPILVEDCEGLPNAAYDFNGINDFIEIPYNSKLNFDRSSQFSFSIWVKIPNEQTASSGASADIISKWNSNLSMPYSYTIRVNSQFHQNPGRIVAARFDGICNNISKIESSISINDDEWHHVVFQRQDSGLLELFIDGELEGTFMDIVECDVQNYDNILLGIRTKKPIIKNAFTGSIDNIRIYERVLNASEITTIHDKLILSEEEIISKSHEILIFPNPVVNGAFEIINNSNIKITTAQLFSINGQRIQNIDIENTKIVDLPRGVYIVKLLFEDNFIYAEKIVVE